MGKFFKVNPTKVFKSMYGFDTIPQHDQIFDLMETHDHTVVAASRRGGKTKAASAAVIAKFLQPKTETMIIAPQHSLTENIFFNNVYRFIRDKELEVIRANIKDRIIEGANGSIIYARSLQRATSIVGVGLDLAVMDEIALVDKDDWWDQELRPTLTEKQGHTLWISTPRGYNHFKDKFDQGQDPDSLEWASIRYTIHDLPYIDAAYVKKLEDSYARAGRDAYFRQEFLASFEAFEGQIYSIPPVVENFDRTIKFDMVFAGLDVGYNHSTALIIFGVLDTTYYLLDYYVASKKTTEQHAEKFKELIDLYDIDLIYIDYAAAQFAWDLVALHDISTLRANKSVLDGIARVQTLVGSKQVIVHESLWGSTSELRREWGSYQWQEDKEQPVKLNDDLMDAMRYALYTFDTKYNLRSTMVDEGLDG